MKDTSVFRQLFWTLCLAPALLSVCFAQESAPVVAISTGQVRGILTADGTAVYKNIPFAQPPVGELRWREPQPAQAWSGVRDATTFGPMCNQNDNKQLPHSEDCLQLNVWTPQSARTAALPVMVWIHGGGNVAGSGVEALFNGEVLASHDVVVVTINYRLGILGFFAHPELTRESPMHASGNYGLADQIMALHWVQENIASFGGDPGNVTIFGESAGAFDVNALMASPLSAGLFHKAIAQSGPLGTQLSLADAEKRGTELAARLNLSGADELKKLRALSDLELMESAGPGGGMGINVDGWILKEPLTTTFAAGRQHKVPLLIGSNSQEFAPRGIDDIRQELARQYGPLADRALALYGVDGPNDPAPDPENGSVLMQFTTDNTFRCGTVEELIWHAAAGNVAYQYQFSRTVHGQEDKGAPHASEIPFIFGTLPVWQSFRHYDASDEKYAPQMQKYWSNFAKTGNPNGSMLVQWPQFDANKRAYLNFTDAGPVANSGLRREVCALYSENQRRLGL